MCPTEHMPDTAKHLGPMLQWETSRHLKIDGRKGNSMAGPDVS